MLAVCLPGCAPDYDLVIRGGTVFDGSGAPGVVADVAIDGDRIVAIGEIDGRGERTIDAAGLYVAPGFIDMHSHSEVRRLLDGGQGPSFAFQGITTEIYGETFSMGPRGGRIESTLPEELEGKWETLGGFLDYLEETGTAINVVSYVASGRSGPTSWATRTARPPTRNSSRCWDWCGTPCRRGRSESPPA